MKRSQITLFSDEPEDDKGEWNFPPQTIEQWKSHRYDKRPWRKPDVFETAPGYARCIWYGPDGPQGESATLLVANMEDASFMVSEFNDVAWQFAENGQSTDGDTVAFQVTTFSLKAVKKALRDAGVKLKPGEILLQAVGLGISHLSYFGGEEGYTDSIPQPELR